MKKHKKRIPHLTEEEYAAYLMSLKDSRPQFSEEAFSAAIEKEEEGKKKDQ